MVTMFASLASFPPAHNHQHVHSSNSFFPPPVNNSHHYKQFNTTKYSSNISSKLFNEIQSSLDAQCCLTHKNISTQAPDSWCLPAPHQASFESQTNIQEKTSG